MQNENCMYLFQGNPARLGRGGQFSVQAEKLQFQPSRWIFSAAGLMSQASAVSSMFQASRLRFQPVYVEVSGLSGDGGVLAL
jgi:hypothetical protein